MAATTKRNQKQAPQDSANINRAKRASRGKTDAQRASELTTEEHEKNRLLREANERFFKSGIDIKDIYGVLQD